VVRPRSCRVIYYFDTPALGRRHQSFGRVSSDSVFIVVFWVHRGCLRCRIHASPVAAVSLRISQMAATLFLMITSQSTGAVCAIESMRHPWQQFRWWFLSPQGLFALSNPCVTRGSSFVDYFWVGRDSVFVDDFWSQRGSLLCRIHASPVEAVLLMIFVATGVFCAVESMRHPWKQFRWGFLSL